MKTIPILFLFVGLSAFCLAQTDQVITGQSPVKKIKAGKTRSTQSIKTLPDLVIKDEVFTDPNGNNTIDAYESCTINFKIENLGKGVAKNVVTKIAVKNKEIQGLSFDPAKNIGDIGAGEVKEVQINLTGSSALTDGIAEFKIEVLEDLGFDAFPLEMKIETHPFLPPNLVLADAVFSTEDGGKIKLNYPIQLKVLIQNIGNGDAKEVGVGFTFNNPNCLLLGETDQFPVGTLKKGESRELNFLFTANRRYTSTEIPIAVKISEGLGKYARDTLVRVNLEQNLVAQNNVVISAISTSSTVVQKASLTSDVDKNIPDNKTTDPKKYALIIGNEDYSKYQPGLSSEMNVAFARNDASIFREYVIKTLGFPEGNVFLLLDATIGEMNQKLDLINKLAIKTGNEAELLFYYAGHGLPDETTKIPYLIPVDVSGSNLTSGIKLSEVYKKLGGTGAKKIVVFLDACFSGGARESGLLASRSVKIKPTAEILTGNMVSCTASSLEQSALPYSREKHGLFTYFLLKKFQETKGDLTYAQLYDYLSKTISIESLKINEKEQDPSISVSPDAKDNWQSWKFR